jgi:hypothetical protein
MSEETNVPESDGTWSGLKKTLIGTISTAILAGGTWFTTTLIGGGEEKSEPTPTQQSAPVINLNVDNSSKNTSTNSGGGNTTIIREKVVEKPAKTEPSKPKKEGDEFKEKEPQW